MAGNLLQSDLEKMGLIEESPGVFRKKGTGEVHRKNTNGKIEPIKTAPFHPGFFRGESTEAIFDRYSGGLKGIFIPGNVPSSKNSKRIGKGIILESENCVRYRRETGDYWRSFKGRFQEMEREDGKPLLVSFFFIRGNRHRFDYHNIVQLPCDLMTEYGWIEDDNSDIIIPDFRCGYAYDKARPGVIIKIIKL